MSWLWLRILFWIRLSMRPSTRSGRYIGYLARLSGWSAWTGPRTRRKQGSLAASGVEAVMERYWEACAVVVELWRSGVYVGRIARRAGLGHGYIYGMLRDAGENPK